MTGCIGHPGDGRTRRAASGGARTFGAATFRATAFGVTVIGATMLGSVGGAVPLAGAVPASVRPASAGYGPTTTRAVLTGSTSLASPSAAVKVCGSGFGPAGTVTLTLNGVTVGRTATTASGTFCTTVTIPPGTAAGSDEIIATDTSGHSSNLAIDVTEVAAAVTARPPAAGAAPPGAPSGAASPGGVLAFTGADVRLTAGVGAGAVALGGLLVLAARRRRTTA